MVEKNRRIHAYVWSGIAAAAMLGIFIASYVSSGEIEKLFTGLILSVVCFTFLSCLILANNFIGELVADIFSWGFVQMPGLIFTLDLDGIIWLLTVKLLFWILGLLLAVLCGLLGVVIGAGVSVFVYPFALYKAYRGKEGEEVEL